MTGAETFSTMVETLRRNAGVQTVYGEPIVSEGKTTVPVAKLAYGFGGGYGSGGDEDGTDQGEGGGFGGGVSVRPVGVVEITGTGTRFVRFDARRQTALALCVGVVLGVLLGRRRRGR